MCLYRQRPSEKERKKKRINATNEYMNSIEGKPGETKQSA
jgi:hypothetical protein